MFTQLGRTVAVLACTLVFSATCVLSAVGPAQTVTTDATATRPIA